MYEDAPGIYFNSHAQRVSNEVAAAAGYPIREMERARRLQERKAELWQKAQQEIDEEMAAIDEAFGEERVTEEPETLTTESNRFEATGRPEHEPLEILRETKEGAPRETNIAVMKFMGQHIGWTVLHKKTGVKLGEGLGRLAAENLLQNTTR